MGRHGFPGIPRRFGMQLPLVAIFITHIYIYNCIHIYICIYAGAKLLLSCACAAHAQKRDRHIYIYIYTHRESLVRNHVLGIYRTSRHLFMRREGYSS